MGAHQQTSQAKNVVYTKMIEVCAELREFSGSTSMSDLLLMRLACTIPLGRGPSVRKCSKDTDNRKYNGNFRIHNRDIRGGTLLVFVKTSGVEITATWLFKSRNKYWP